MQFLLCKTIFPVSVVYVEMHFGNPEAMLNSDSELANLQNVDNPRQVTAGTMLTEVRDAVIIQCYDTVGWTRISGRQSLHL